MDEQTYEEYRDEIKGDQESKDYDDIKESMRKHSEFMVELDKLPKQSHIWVDRGAVLSCEGAAHANHRVFKRVR